MQARNQAGRYQCDCCGYFTLGASKEYAICEVCFWEDNWYQLESPTDDAGPNSTSLLQSRRNFSAFGASQREWLKYVHPPAPDQLPDNE